MSMKRFLAAMLATIIIASASFVFAPAASAAQPFKFNRSFGVLLHPTSLPGAHGIGDLGPGARKFVEYLAACGATLWQTLPIGPTGYGDSPYASLSAFAGNPMLISPDSLAADGLLSPEDLSYIPVFPEDKVDFGAVINYKRNLFNRAFEKFRSLKKSPLVKEYRRFASEQGAVWLDDYALFMALKEKHGGAAWSEWDPAYSRREPKALAAARIELAEKIEFFKFLQFIFFKQWNELKKYANACGIKLVGDIPIFVAYDCADVWVHPELFKLDAKCRPVAVAGVPPDFFSATGQYWGNPVYDWKAMEKNGFAWWVARFKNSLALFDVIRIDHFRGFEAYWEIPASEKTAVNGRWVKAPGRGLFSAVRKALGDLPVIAEDLGVITPEVESLRDEFGFYGMKILQFGFSGNSGDAAKYLPHTFATSRAVVYTGTHDNETAAGWYKNLDENTKKFFRDYTRSDGRNPADTLIRLAMASVCDVAIVPMQDITAADNSGRMNTPGTLDPANWSYRVRAGELKLIDALRIKNYCRLFGR